MLAIVALVGLGVGVAVSQRADTEASTEVDHPVGDSAAPTPSASLSEVPRTFSFTMPEVLGVPLEPSKGPLRAAVANAQAENGSLSLQSTYVPRVAFRITKREADSAKPGTVLQVGDRRALPESVTLTIPSDAQPGDPVNAEFRLVVAKEPIRFHGDSIHIEGAGSAMVTWLDGNSNIHQKTVALPAWFRVPAGVENFSAQRSLGDGGSITCQIRYNDRVTSHSTSSGPYAICSVSS
jgi:hypothetical protein